MSKFFPLKLSGVSSFHVAYLSVLWLIFLSANHLKAQDVPNAINYQAIVRDSETFQPISDQGAYVSVEFLDGPDGDVLYQEEFPSIQTGKAGLLNLSLGQGDPVINNFGSIAWDSGNVWLRLSVDIGNGLNILQETPFNTVPYAFYAETSGGSDDDSDPTNELIQSISLDVSDLEIVEGDQITTVDLSSLIDDNDSDPTNERIDSLRYNAEESVLSVFESGSQFDVELGIPEIEPGSIQDLSLSEDDILTITNNEEATPIDLTPYLDNTDIQTLSLNNTILRISGSESEVDLADLPSLGTDDDSDPSNELQELDLEGNMLSISNSPTNSQVDLSPYLDNTDNQIMTLDGTILTLTGDPNPIDLSELPNTGTDADADPLNEIQDLELIGSELSITNNPSAAVIDLSLFNTDNQDLTLSGTTLILSGDGTTVDLNALPGLGDDADADPSNEIQTIESTDGSITVTPNGNDFDLSVAATDGSETIVNDGQNTTVNGTGTAADPYSVDVPDNLDNDPSNEIQDISTDNTSGNIALSDGSTLTLNVDDADADATNEIQDISTDNASGNISISDGSTLTINVDDADANPENELQNIQLIGDFLSLTNVSPAAQVDMRPFDQSDLSQGHIFIGDGSNEASEVLVFGDVELESSGDSKVRGIQGTEVSDLAPGNGQVLVYSAADSEWQPRSPASVTNPSTTSYYSIDPFDFVEIADVGIDLGANNALKFYNEDGPFAMLLSNEIISMAAPIHLPHGAEINNLKVYFRDSGPGNVRISLLRKNMTNFSTIDQSITTVLVGGLSGDKVQNINISSNNVIDNSVYSYRLLVRLSATEPSESVAIGDVQQAVYGAVIEYTTN